MNLAKSAFWVIVSEIIFNLSGYVIHSLVGRILGPEDYGRYGLVVTLTTMVIILIGNGIPTAMAKYISEIFETQPRLIRVIKHQAIILQTLLIGAITIIFFFSAPLIARLLGDPTLAPLFRLSTLVIPAFAAASFYFSYFTGLHRFNLQSVLKTFRSIIKVLAIVSLAYFFKVEGSVAGYIVAPLSIFLVALCLDKILVAQSLPQVKEKSAEPEPTFDYKKLLHYAWQVIVFFLAYELLISIDLYLVKGILHDDYQTGIYNAAITVGRIPYYIFYALTVILLPVISKSTAEKKTAETSAIIGHSLRLMVILLVPGIILMAKFSAPIINIFFGSRYLAAALPMSILVYGVGFLTIFYVMSFVMNGAGKTKIPMFISIIGVVINTVLNYILIKRYALVGSAVAISITSFIVMILMLYYVYRDFGVLIRLKSILRIGLSGILLYAFSLFFSAGPVIFILWSLLLGGGYLFVLYLLKEITAQDLQYLRTVFAKKKATEAKEALSGTEPSA